MERGNYKVYFRFSLSLWEREIEGEGWIGI